MALNAKIGSFTTGAGSSQTISGLGFAPRALLFWTGNDSTSGTFVSGLDLALNFWTFGSQSHGLGQFLHAQNGVNTANATQGQSSRPIETNGWHANSLTQTNDGFTIAWPGSQTTGIIVNYLALGGDASGQVVQADIPKTAAVGSTIDVTGFGFAPAAVLAISTVYGDLPPSGSRVNTKSLGFGVFDGTNQWSWHVATKNNANPPATGKRWDEDKLIAACTDAGVAFSAKVIATLPDGVRLQIVDAAAQHLEGRVHFLGLTGLVAKATVQAKSTAGAPVTQNITAAGLTPLAVLFGAAAQTAAGYSAALRTQLGGSDGTNHRVVAAQDKTGSTPSVNATVSRTDKDFLKINNDAQTVEAVGSATISGSTIALALSTNDAVAARFGQISFATVPKQFSAAPQGDGNLIAPRLERPVFFAPTIRADSLLVLSRLGAFPQFVPTFTADSLLAATLKTKAGFPATMAGGSALTVAGLRQTFHITPTFTGASAFVAKFGFPQPIGRVTFTADGALVVPGLRKAFAATPTFVGASQAIAFLSYLLPVPNVATADDLPGTVNFVRNSSLEDPNVGTNDWTMTGGTVTRVTTAAWHGAASAQAVFTNGATNAQLKIRSQGGLNLKPAEPMVGSLRLKNAVGPFDVWLDCVYADATSDVSDPVTLTPGVDWTWVKTATLIPNPAKQVDHLDLVIQRTGVGSGAITLLADGAQIEEDQGTGASTFAYGGYHDGFHSWVAAHDNSIALRQPIPMTIAGSGVGGVIVIDAHLYRCTYDGVILDDLSEFVIEATASADATRDVTWTLDCQLTQDGWDKLTVYEDWVMPWLTVTYPDGSVVDGPTGLFQVYDSPKHRPETGTIIQLDARDPLALLGEQDFSGPVVVRAGTDKARAAKILLDSAVLTHDAATGKARYAIPDSGSNLQRDKEWPRDTTRLALVNELVRGAACYPLWTTNRGLLHTRKRGKDRLKHREPVRVWAGNVPTNVVLDDRVPRVSNLPSEVVGVVERTSKAGRRANEIALTSDDPHGRVHVRHKVTHPSNPRAVWWANGRKHTQKIHHPLVDSQDDARDIAAALMEELGLRDNTITLTVLPDPSVDLLRETVYLAIWDAAGDEVAVGQYAVLNVKYGFTPTDALMHVELGRIDDIDNLLEVGLSVGVTSTSIAAANANRRRIEIENKGVATCWLNSAGGAAIVNQGDSLDPGQTLIYQTTTAIAGICAAGTVALGIVETTK